MKNCDCISCRDTYETFQALVYMYVHVFKYFYYECYFQFCDIIIVYLLNYFPLYLPCFNNRLNHRVLKGVDCMNNSGVIKCPFSS